MLQARRLHPSAGNSLVGILAAVGIFGVISAAMGGLIADIWKAQNSAKSLSEANAFHEEVRTHLADRQACINTFKSLGSYANPVTYVVTTVKNGDGPAPTPTPNPTPSIRYQLATPYGGNTFEISSMKIVYPNPANSPVDPNEAVFSLSYKPRGQTLGPDVLKARDINLSVKIDDAGQLIDCISKAKASGEGIWRRNTANPNRIFYTDGPVGVGLDNPTATLDIAGSVRLAKNGSQPFACDASHDAEIVMTQSYKLCVCKPGSGWIHTSDGTTACSWGGLKTLYMWQAVGHYTGGAPPCGWSTTPTYCTIVETNVDPYDSCWDSHQFMGTCTYGTGGTCPAWATSTGGQRLGACP